MTAKCNLIFLLLFFGIIGINRGLSQTYQINPNCRVLDDEYRKMILMLHMWELKDDSVKENRDISSWKVGDTRKKKKVVLPNNAFTKKTRNAYGYVFYANANNPFSTNYLLVVVENYRRTIHPTVIYIDRNNDFDLTNDGEPLILRMGERVRFIVDTSASLNAYGFDLEHYPTSMPEGNSSGYFMKFTDKEYLALDSDFVSTYYCLRIKRINVVSDTIFTSNDTFILSFKDVNCNGIYNDSEIDKLLISRINQEPIVRNGWVKPSKGEWLFEWNNHVYILKSMKQDASEVLLFRDTQRLRKYTLNAGEKLPRFRYCTAQVPQKRKSIRKDKAQITYLYIWRDTEEEFISDSAALHKLSRIQSDSFKVICLNYGTAGRYVALYNKIFKVGLHHGFSSNKINKKLKLQKIPTGIVIDRRQRILGINIPPSEVMNYLH